MKLSNQKALHLLVTLVIAMVSCSLPCDGVTVSWVGTSGDWQTGTNWSTGQVPGAQDTVVINGNGTYTISVRTPATVDTLIVGAQTGTQTVAVLSSVLTLGSASKFGPQSVLAISGGGVQGNDVVDIEGTLNWAGGSLSGPGTFRLSAGSVSTLSGNDKGLSSRLENAGTLTFAGGRLLFGNVPSDAVLTNLPSGVIELAGNGDFARYYGGNHLFANAGTLNMHPAVTNRFSGVAFTQNGIFNAAPGYLSLEGGGAVTQPLQILEGTVLNLAGDFAYRALVGGPGLITFSGGTHDFQGNFLPEGRVEFNAGRITISSPIGPKEIGPIRTAAVIFNAPQALASITLNGGALGGSGDITLTNAFVWSSGSVEGTGKLVFAPGCVTELQGDGTKGIVRLVENAGTMTYSGSGVLFGSQPGNYAFNNLPGASLLLNSEGDLRSYYGGDHSITNAGLIRKIGPGTTTQITGVRFENSGTVLVESGTLTMEKGGGNTGSVEVSASAALLLGGNLASSGTIAGAGNFEFLGGAQVFTGPFLPTGFVQIRNGTVTLETTLPPSSVVTVSGGSLQFNAAQSLGNVVLNGGTIGGNGTIIIRDSLSWTAGNYFGTGKLVLTNGSVADIAGDSWKSFTGTIENRGTVNLTKATLTFGGNPDVAVFNNQASGVVNLTTNAAFSRYYGGAHAFNNDGTLNKSGSPGVTFGGVAFNQGGTLNLTEGALTMDAGGTFRNPVVVQAGATLNLGGTFAYTGSGSVSGPGTISFLHGNHTFSADFLPSGSVEFRGGTITISNTLPPVAIGELNNAEVRFYAPQRLGALSVNGGTLRNDSEILIEDSLTWKSGNINLEGRLVIGPHASAQFLTDSWKGFTGTIENRGNLETVGNAQIRFGSEPRFAVFTNAPGAVFTIQDAADFGQYYGGAHAWNNAGILNKRGNGSARTYGVAFRNYATVSLEAGTLSLESGGRIESPLQVNTATTLRLGGDFFYNATVGGPGDIAFLGGWHRFSGDFLPTGKLAFGSATVTISNTIAPASISPITSATVEFFAPQSLASLTLSGGTLRGTGELLIRENFDWTSGSVFLSRVTIGEGALARLTTSDWKGLAGTLEIAGRMEHEAAILSFGGEPRAAVLTNRPGGVIAVKTNAHFGNYYSAPHAFYNAGTLTKSGPGTVSRVYGITFTSTGLVEPLEGTLSLESGGRLATPVEVRSGATLALGRDFQCSDLSGAGAFIFDGGNQNLQGQFLPTGSVNFKNGTITITNTLPPVNIAPITAAVVVFNAPQTFTNLTLAGGALAGNGDLTITREFNWMSGSLLSGGKLRLPKGSTGRLTGDGYKHASRTIENGGYIRYSGSALALGAEPAAAGVVQNLEGGVFEVAGPGSIGQYYGAAHRFENRGTLLKSGVGTTSRFSYLSFTNSGTLSVNSGTLEIDAAAAAGGKAAMGGSAEGTLRVTGNLLGDTTNPAFAPRHRVVFTPGARVMEAMSADKGPVAEGLINNFSFARLELPDYTSLTLQDGARNASGSTPEAVYVDTLLVNTNASIDLNGLKLYARVARVAGSVKGGSITLLPDGGELRVGAPTGGSLSTPGQVDEWQFHGTAGQLMTFVANPGTNGNFPALAPTLDRVLFRVVDASGNQLASCTNRQAGDVAAIVGMELASTGTYRVQVQAAPEFPNATGNYELAVWTNQLVPQRWVNDRFAGGQPTLLGSGEIHEWSFYGATNMSVGAVLAPGTPASSAVPEPVLGYGELRLLDEEGKELWSSRSTSLGSAASLPLAALPYPGVYRIQGYAAADHFGLSGNYTNAFWLARIDTEPLVLNQRQTGETETPFSEDRWVFNARAGQQVRFDLLNASQPLLKFALTGPGNWVGFADLPGDSDLVTLPQDGEYVLSVSGSGIGVSYSFQLKETSVVALSTDAPIFGEFVGNGQAQLFRLELSENSPLLLYLGNSGAGNLTEVYVRKDLPPTRGDFGARNLEPGSSHQILVPGASAGTYYVLVYGDAIRTPGQFQIQASTSGLLVRDSLPRSSVASVTTSLSIYGAGFDPTVSVDLVNSAGTAFPLSGRSVDSFVQMTVEIPANTVPAGTYSVRLQKPTGSAQLLPNAITLEASGGYQLDYDLIVPGWLGRHAVAELFVTYTNNGAAVMPSPLFIVGSLDPQVGNQPLLTLDRSIWTQGFWTAALPGGFDHSVQFLGSGASPGVLNPGEFMRVPVYYAGIRQPWDFRLTDVPLEVAAVTADDPAPIDWPTLKTSLRPEWISPQGWEVVFQILTNEVGATWGSFVDRLSKDAIYLGRLGQRVEKVDDYWGFQIRKANGLNPLPVLSSMMDIQLRVSGPQLGIGRSFASTVDQRNRLGEFGWGWVMPWNSSLKVLADGAVEIINAAGVSRRYEPDSRGPRFFSPRLDGSELTALAGGVYQLAETDGSKITYSADGRFSAIEDRTGARVSANYSDGRLTRLAHSSGGYLDFHWNGAGLIERIESSEGRTALYAYDAGKHLLSVTDHRGMITRYEYITGQGSPREHALSSILMPSGTRFAYTFDEFGRVTSFGRNNGAARLTLTYGPDGIVTMTDATGVVNRNFYDARGSLAKVEDGAGNLTVKAYDDDHRVSEVTDSLGRVSQYQYACCSLVNRHTDARGGMEGYSYTSGNHRSLASTTDTLGHTTQYTYGDSGNLEALTLPDGTQRRFAYDGTGNVISYRNARGDTLSFAYDGTGRLTQKTLPGGRTVRYEYSLGTGKSVRITDSGWKGGASIHMDYNAANNLTRVSYPDGRFLEFSYDEGGRRTRTVDHLGFAVNYSRDPAGWLSQVTDAAGKLLIKYTYDASGRIVREDRGNQTYSKYSYNRLGQLQEIVHCRPTGETNALFQYTYDAAARVVAVRTLDGGWAYTYDVADQLTRARFTAARAELPDQDLAFVYDSAGNRIQTVENGSTLLYSVNSRNQYTNVGPAVMTYDTDGNLTRERNGTRETTYTYDAENRLTRVVSPEGTVDYEYDPIGNRFAVTQNGQRTEYLNDPTGIGVVAAEFNSSGSLVASYAHGLGLVGRTAADGSQCFYDFDQLGSTCGLSDSTGAYANRYAYLPFGQKQAVTETIPNSFEFAGAFGVVQDSTSLLYMRARYYHPGLGRFVSEDPLGVNGGSINLYLYADNSPIQSADAAGTAPHSGHYGSTYCINGRPRIVYYWDRMANDDPFWACVKAHEEVHAQKCRDRGRNPETCAEVTADELEAFQAMLNCATSEEDRATILNTMDIVRKGEYDERCKPPPKKPTPAPKTPKKPGSKKKTKIVTAADPNQKLGPSGGGTASYINQLVLPYRVDFENDPGATAPAQQVIINDPLSPDLDWNSFEITGAGFGDVSVAVAPGTRHFQTNLVVNCCGNDFTVELEIGIRADTGTVFARYNTLDPRTLLPPDASVGFLPPEDGTGRGQGHFSFLVRAKSGLPSGTAIRNIAYISFDNQPIIATNQRDPKNAAAGKDPTKEALVTIDQVAPTSRITPLALESGRTFEVQWSGQDDAGGGGIASYDIYAATNQGPFGLWLEGTAKTVAAFTGLPGDRYSFYSVARDYAGNIESTPAGAQAFTVVSTNGPALAAIPEQFYVVGQSRSFTNHLASAASGRQYLYSLDDAAIAAGLTIDRLSGVVAWRPECAQGNTTNQFTVWVTDAVWAYLGDAATFTAVVGSCEEPGPDSFILPVTERARLPLYLAASGMFSQVTSTLELPVPTLSDPSLAPYPGASSIVAKATLTPQTSNTFGILLEPPSGSFISGTQQVAWLEVTPNPTEKSGFAFYHLRNWVGQTPSGGAVPLPEQKVRVVILGNEPLLEATTGEGQPALTLYGLTGTTNVLDYTVSLEEPWSSLAPTVLTNKFQVYHPACTNDCILFYRARKVAP